MKIAIDISSVVYETGVSSYTKNLVESLLKIDTENEYILYGGSLRRKKELRKFVNSLKGNYRAKIFGIPPSVADFMWNRLHVLKIENLIGKIDVFHSSDWTQPPTDACKVTTVHDMVPIKYSMLSHPKIVAVHKRRLKHIKNELDYVIVPSNTTKKDLSATGISGKKIKVIPEASDAIYKPVKSDSIKALKRKYRIKGKYLLAVGVTPRKNIERIIESYEKIKAGMEMKLVFVGEPKTRLTHERGVIYTGHVPQHEMPVFYAGSEVLVYPSLYEGFGLPILDAFACKTAVVTSNVGSMKEVAGDSAVLVDPYSVESISKGIIKAMKERKKMVTMGLIRAKIFSWDETARETLLVYNSCINVKK